MVLREREEARGGEMEAAGRWGGALREERAEGWEVVVAPDRVGEGRGQILEAVLLENPQSLGERGGAGTGV